jgi:hypothetical protein
VHPEDAKETVMRRDKEKIKRIHTFRMSIMSLGFKITLESTHLQVPSIPNPFPRRASLK